MLHNNNNNNYTHTHTLKKQKNNIRHDDKNGHIDRLDNTCPIINRDDHQQSNK